MAALARDRGLDFRPHFKTHKSVEIARRQMAAGALGMTVAKLDEATVLIDAGITDVLLGYEIVAPPKLGTGDGARGALAADPGGRFDRGRPRDLGRRGRRRPDACASGSRSRAASGGAASSRPTPVRWPRRWRTCRASGSTACSPMPATPMPRPTGRRSSRSRSARPPRCVTRPPRSGRTVATSASSAPGPRPRRSSSRANPASPRSGPATTSSTTRCRWRSDDPGGPAGAHDRGHRRQPPHRGPGRGRRRRQDVRPRQGRPLERLHQGLRPHRRGGRGRAGPPLRGARHPRRGSRVTAPARRPRPHPAEPRRARSAISAARTWASATASSRRSSRSTRRAASTSTRVGRGQAEAGLRSTRPRFRATSSPRRRPRRPLTSTHSTPVARSVGSS